MLHLELEVLVIYARLRVIYVRNVSPLRGNYFVYLSFKFFIQIVSKPSNQNPLMRRPETMNMANFFKGRIQRS